MANRHRGEIDAEIGGARRTLVLTLGALAELENAFGAAGPAIASAALFTSATRLPQPAPNTGQVFSDFRNRRRSI